MIHRAIQVRQAFPRSKVHILGAGGPVSVALSLAFGAHSTASAGWRVRAAFGCILMLMGRQVRGVDENQRSRKRLLMEMKNDWFCGCPTCGSERSYIWKARTLGRNFSARATHNLYQQFNDIERVSSLLKPGHKGDSLDRAHSLAAILGYVTDLLPKS